MALITLQDYKSYYNITTTVDDVQNQQAIDTASAMIDSFLGRSLGVSIYTQLFDGGKPSLQLEATPVVSITSLKQNGTAYSNYTLYADTGIIKNGTMARTAYGAYPTFTAGLNNIEVIYAAGNALNQESAYCLYVLTKKIMNDKKLPVSSANAASGIRPSRSQSLHGEARSVGSTGSSSQNIDFLASQASIFPADVLAILRNYL